jgi:AraC family transcriptional regulator
MIVSLGVRWTMFDDAGHIENAAVRPLNSVSRMLPGPVIALGQTTETGWRQRPAASIGRPPPAVATRWRSLEDQVVEVEARTPDDTHLLCIVLRRMNIRLSVSDRLVKAGTVTPGTLHLTEPGVPAECVFTGAYDAIHLHIPNGLIAECTNELNGGYVGLATDAAPSHDPVIERLGMELLGCEQLGGILGPIFADCLATGIVARLLALRAGTANHGKRAVTKLVKWRLKRVIDYIEAHLDGPIRLGDLAGAAGLTKMHFAAQFRAATGLRPHEYLVRCRIERAQVLLSKNVPTVHVALAVGFQSQAHFTNVFKRFVGQPPHSWSRSLGETSTHFPQRK